MTCFAILTGFRITWCETLHINTHTHTHTRVLLSSICSRRFALSEQSFRASHVSKGINRCSLKKRTEASINTPGSCQKETPAPDSPGCFFFTDAPQLCRAQQVEGAICCTILIYKTKSEVLMGCVNTALSLFTASSQHSCCSLCKCKNQTQKTFLALLKFSAIYYT